MDRQAFRQRFKEIREIVLIDRREQGLRGAADAKPCQLRQRLIGEQPPAQAWHRGFQLGRDVGKSHRRMFRREGGTLSPFPPPLRGKGGGSAVCRVATDEFKSTTYPSAFNSPGSA